MKKIKIVSHRRSGTHLLMETLKLNFPGIWPIKTHDKTNEGIYIQRDVREVLTSCFIWWRYSGESKVCGIAPSFQNLNIQQYIRGKAKLDWFAPDEGNVRQWEVDQGMFSSPVDFWADHVQSGGFTVSYAKLVENPGEVMEEIGEALGLGRPLGLRVDKMVGHSPSGAGSRWENWLGEDDLRLIREKLSIL